MNLDDLKGKRFVCLARVSSDPEKEDRDSGEEKKAEEEKEETNSTKAQIKLMMAFGAAKGMVFVRAVALEGVTGSLPGRRKDLQKLLDDKRTKDDFDVLLVQRLDRLTRGGSNHGIWFEHEAQRLGIRVIAVGDDIPDGRYANVIKVLKYEAAQEQAFSISQRSTQGSQLALEAGRNITSSHTPYGCWRIYFSSDGRPSHVIRDCRDGRQQKLDPKTYAVIDTYGAVGGGSKGHYRKQKSELVLLMPGDPDEAGVIREIFDLHYNKGWGGKRIADRLNRRGVRSPRDVGWSQHQVEVLYEQEVYTGRSVGNRSSGSIYHERQPDAPKKVNMDPAMLATAERIPLRQRPRSEWFVQEQPLMADFLDPELRAMAMAAHERLWARRGDPDRPKQSKSKHVASDYLLTGLLFAKQDGESLTGVLCGRVGAKARYYRHRRGRRGYMKGSIFNGMFLAEPLERAVIGELQLALDDQGDLEQRVAALVAELSQQAPDADRLDELRRRRDQLRRKVELIVASLDDETLAEAKEELDRLRGERRTLDEEIVAAEAQQSFRALDADDVAADVMANLRALAQVLRELPTFALRQLLATFVERVEVDMETKAATIRLVVPVGGCRNGLLDGEDAMRLVATPASSTSYETHQEIRALLTVLDCDQTLEGSRRCYRCRKRAA